MKKLIEKYKQWHNRRQIELDRDLDFYETDIFHLLRLIFIKGQLNKKTICKKRRLSKTKFEDLIGFLKAKDYIVEIIASKPKSEILYGITDKGTDYLLEFRKSKQEKSYTKWIMFATIVLAISATITIIDILINNDRTRNYIASGGTSLIRSFVEFIGGALHLIFWIFIFWIFYRIIKYTIDYIKKKREKK